MRRVGYSSHCMCVCVTVLRSQMRHWNGHQYKVGDDQKDLNEADFWISVLSKLGKQCNATLIDLVIPDYFMKYAKNRNKPASAVLQSFLLNMQQVWSKSVQ